MEETFGLFPTPFTRVHGALDKALVDGLVAHFTAQAVHGNTSSQSLSHTALLSPGESPLIGLAAGLITPRLVLMMQIPSPPRTGRSLVAPL